MSIFTPKYMKPVPVFERLSPAALQKARAVTRPRQLRKMALEAPEEEVRLIAVEKLADDAALMREIALTDRYGDSRRFAIQALERLGDAETLEKVGMSSKFSQFRELAVDALERLGKDAALARIAMNPDRTDDRYFTARDAAQAVGDQALLIEIARKAPVDSAREAAAERVEDAETLVAVATSDPEGSVRFAAVRRIDDQPVLCRIALEDKSGWVRGAAAERVADPEVLKRIALTDADNDPRLAAVKNPHLTDQAALSEVALRDGDGNIRAEALRKVDDPGVLNQIALECEDIPARVAAIQKVRDAAILERIADEEGRNNHSASWEAALRLAQIAPARAVDVLVRLMERDRHAHWGTADAKHYREKAIEFLKKRYKNADDPAVRERIAALPQGYYGWADPDSCMHWDETTHFDLSR